MTGDDDCSWSDVQRLLRDLKNDGYQPTLLETNTSEVTPEKTVRLDVERREPYTTGGDQP